MYNILLIDDEEMKRIHIEEILEEIEKKYDKGSISLTHSIDGESGLESLVPETNLVLLDYYLDDTGEVLGTNFIPEIRKKNTNAKIWMYTSEKNLEKFKRDGADDLLNPLDINCFEKLYNFIESQISGQT